MSRISLKELEFIQEIIPEYFSVKEAVFPFNKFPNVDVLLGPEMKSTGEVMGFDKDFGIAFSKSQIAAGNSLPTKGLAFISLKDNWFWLADSKSITNTLDLIISRYEINNLEIWSVKKDIQLPQLTIDLETKTFSSELELLKSFAEILNLQKPFNFFVKEYEKKIDWFSLFSRYKFYVYSALGLFAIFFASAVIQFSYLSISNNLLKDKIMDTFKEKFPSETLESDLISQVNGLINQGQIDYSALNAISINSDAVSSSENIILVSIGYEQTRFIIEVQTNSYDQLQDYVDLVNSLGLEVNLGASRRVNNFIQGEISINGF